MLNSDIRVTSRLFSKERKRATEKSEIILSDISKKRLENQLELSWMNTNQLEKSYIVIACQVMLNEWNRLFPDFRIFRAFLDYQEDGESSYNLTFEIPRTLSKDEIKSLVSSAVRLLESCLLRVTERMAKQSAEMANQTVSAENYGVNQIEFDDQVQNYEGDVPGMDAQQWMIAQSSILNSDWKDDNLRLQETVKEYLKELTQERIAKDELLQKNSDLSYQLEEAKLLNKKLDQANLILIEAVKKAKGSKNKGHQIEEIDMDFVENELDLDETKDEKRTRRQRYSKLEKENKRYQEMIDQLLSEKEAIIREAQQDVKQLEDELIVIQKRTHEDDAKLKKLLSEQQMMQEREDALKEDFDVVNSNLAKTKEAYAEKVAQLENMQIVIDETQAKVWRLETDVNEWKRKHEFTQKQLTKEQTEYEEDTVKWEHSYKRMDEAVSNLKKRALKYQLLFEEVVKRTSSLEMEIKPAPVTSESIAMQNLFNEIKEVPLTLEELTDLDDHYEPDPSKGHDVMNDMVRKMTVDQSKVEKEIYMLFEKSKNPVNDELKVPEEEYALDMAELTYLPVRWNKIYQINLINKNMDFLKWCLPYIKNLENFWDQIGALVKQPMFENNVVLMDNRTFVLLKAYSQLSSYLDTYYVKPAQYVEQYATNKGTK